MSPKRRTKKPIFGEKGTHDKRPPKRGRKSLHRPMNRHSMETASETVSSSAKKLRASGKLSDNAVDASFGYRVIEFLSVFSAISAVVKCKKCDGDVTFTEASVRGLGFKLLINCPSCEPTSVFSCPLISGLSYDINRRITFVFRLLGLGYSALKKFCGLMDLPKPVSETTYERISEITLEAVTAVGDVSLKNAAQEEIKLNDGSTDLTVSGDGTWQKRGFSSLFGVSSLIGYRSGNVIDVQVKSSYCKECESWNKFSETPEYAVWKEDHENYCSINHHGSAGKMEVDGIWEMMQRSEEKHSVRYVNYVGDGDSKTYKELLDTSPYKDVTITKKESIGHVQKRMGSRLRNVKKQNKELGGRGNLTDKLINELTIYYGLAIRRNSDNKEKMNTAIWATFLHKISTDKHPQHQWCDFSWCSYLQAKESNTLKTYVHPQPLPEIVQTAIRPIYEDLSADKLLERCEGGFTQNSNESFNSNIWSIAPETKFCGKHTIDFATSAAIGIFNDGYNNVLSMMTLLGLTLGPSSHELQSQIDENRIAKAEVKHYESSKEARKLLASSKKDANDRYLQSEGEVYGAGIAE